MPTGKQNSFVNNHDTDSENEENDLNHERLLKSIGVNVNDDGSNKNTSGQRTEATQDVSVFSLNQKTHDNTNQGKVHLYQLINSLEESSNVNLLKKKINRVKRPAQHLDAPLSKPVAERLQRKVEYEKAGLSVSKWDSIVQRHRKAEHISFPLKQEPLHIRTTDEFASGKSRIVTPLEEQIHALLNGNKCLERSDNDLSVMEEELVTSLSLEKARERRAELQKHRALLSYHEAKNRRQNKIKSRKFHRILRKRKMKATEKSTSDGDVDVKQADRRRAEERASLRHRSGSKWAKSCKVLSKHDAKAKFELEEQLKKHKELVEKSIDNESFEPSKEIGNIEEVNFVETDPALSNYGDFKINVEGNPWLHSHAMSNSIQKLESEDVEENLSTEKASPTDETEDAQHQLKKWLTEEKKSIGNELGAGTVLPVTESAAIKNFKEAFDRIKTNATVQAKSTTKFVETKNASSGNNNVFNIFLNSNENLSENSGMEKSNFLPKFIDNDDDIPNQQRMTIEQAFADDDVIAEFSAEKSRIVEESQPKYVDITLPGWGDWGGAGILPSKRKKKRFCIKANSTPVRKDNTLGHVVINENRDIHITKHQVHEIPFPFVSKEHFEKFVAMPIGNTWNTPGAVHSLIKPRVSTSIGSIISPIDLEALEPKPKKNKTSKKQVGKLLTKSSPNKHVNRKTSRKRIKLQKLEKLKFAE